MNLHSNKTYLLATFSVAILLVLPGCGIMDWFKEKFGGSKPVTHSVSSSGIEIIDDGSRVLVSMGGKAVVTEKSLKEEKKELMESNPQLKAMIAFMDEKQLDRNLAEGLANRVIITRYITENKIDQSNEYKKELDRMSKSVKDMLNTKFFSQKFPAAIGDAEVKDFYEKNKESIPNLMISKGGVKTCGVMFESEKAAQDFLSKTKQAKGDVLKAAKEAGLSDKYKDFGLVNAQSIGMDPILREKIVALKTPSTELIKINDKSFCVVRASGKEQAKYRPFEQVKEDLKQALEKEKAMERLEKELARLKGEFGLNFDEEFFREAKQPGEQAAQVEDLKELKDQKPALAA